MGRDLNRIAARTAKYLGRGITIHIPNGSKTWVELILDFQENFTVAIQIFILLCAQTGYHQKILGGLKAIFNVLRLLIGVRICNIGEYRLAAIVTLRS